MAQIQYIEDCIGPYTKHHYTITLENNVTYNVCTTYTDRQHLEKQVELLHICINLFGHIEYMSCGYMSLHYYFLNGRKLIVDIWYDDNTYHYWKNVEFRTNSLYEMIEYLKREHASLLLPVKVAKME